MGPRSALLRRLLLAAGLLLAQTAAWPASRVWTGADASSDWFDPLNWSPVGVPGNGDDVVIDMSSTVVVAAGLQVAPLNSLTLGDPMGSYSPTLWLSTAITANGAGAVSTLYSSATLDFNSASQSIFTNLVLVQGSSLTQSAAAASGPPPLGSGPFINLRVLDTLTVQAGATITAQGAGYLAAAGPEPGAAAVYGGGGGGHGATGGLGGQIGGGGGQGGGVDDSVSSPADYGSGGGAGAFSHAGGSGGGFILIAAGSVALSGLITAQGGDAPGAPDWGGGGGAGGSVRITAGYLYGQGQVSAAGGAGGTGLFGGGGGGAGGRVSITATGPYTALTSSWTFQTGGGPGGGGTNAGSPGYTGSTYMNPAHWTGGAGPGATSASLYANWYGTSPIAGVTVVFGSSGTGNCVWDLPFVVAPGSVSILSPYAGTLTLANSLAVSGSWTMAAGTVAVSGAYNLFVGGDLTQAGGRLTLDNGNLTLSGAASQNLTVSEDSYFNNFTANAPGSGPGIFNLLSDLEVHGNFSVGLNCTMNLPAGKVLRVGGNWPWIGLGRINADPTSQIVADGSLAQTWQVPPGALGRLRVSNTGGGLSLAAGAWTLGGPGASSELLVDTGAALSIAGASVSLSGDWLDYGSVAAAGSTVAFVSTAVDQAIWAGASFNVIGVSKGGRTLSLSTAAVVAGSVTVNAGTFDLQSATISVGGDWVQGATATVRGGSSTLILNGGGSQRLTLLTGSSFYNLVSSAGASVVVSSNLVVAGRLELDRGSLQMPGRSVLVLGDLVQGGNSSIVATGSTVTLAGAAPQLLGFNTLDTVVVANSHPAGVTLSTDLVVNSSFTVQPGSTFNGSGRLLTMRGNYWQTAGMNYLAANPAHAVVWSPAAGPLWVAAGSTVNASVTIATAAVVDLLGDLSLPGTGNVLDVQPGASLLNAPGGSTITFRDTSDLAPSAGNNWTYGNAAQSWLVFEGGGAARGAAISSNTLGNLLVRLSGGTSTFAHPDLNLSGSLVVDSGVFKPGGNKTISLQGDFIQTGGTVDYASVGTGTVRFNGNGPQVQHVLLNPGHSLEAFQLSGSTQVMALSDLNVRGDLTVAGGVLAAGNNQLRLGGSFSMAPSAGFLAQGSTLTLDGSQNSPPVSFQALDCLPGQAFHGLTVNVSSALFPVPIQADVFTSRVAASTLAFVSAGPFAVGDLELSGGSGPGRILLRPMVGTSPWRLDLLQVSSVSAVNVSSCDASFGLLVQANDGQSLDSGGSLNWNFKPSLAVLPVGAQQAGAPFSVSVQALDSSGNPVPSAAFPVGLTWSELYVSTPAALTLVNGATVFSNVVLRTAQATAVSPQLGPQAFSVTGINVPVSAAPLARLQLLLPGESAVPGSPAGKAGQIGVITAAQPLSIIVRGTDQFWNLQAAAPADLVELSTVSPLASNLPQDQTLAGGATSFSFVVFQASATGMRLTVRDLSNAAILADLSTVFSIFAASLSSPTLSIAVPAYSTVLTLGGALGGTAADAVAVAAVNVALQRKDSGLFFTWSPPAFASAVPVFSAASAQPYLGQSVRWSVPLADASLTDRTSYYVLALATNSSRDATWAESTFTFLPSSLQSGSVGDGGGTAAVLSSAAYGCQLLVTTVAFTAGPAGIAPGGAVAVHWPDGWTRPVSTSAVDPPTVPGQVHVSAASSALEFDPPAAGSTTLGDNWVLFHPAAAVGPGQTVFFTLYGMPPASASGGSLTFQVLTQGDVQGSLKPLTAAPQLALPPGPAARLAFSPGEPLALGSLQTSATMQVRLTDLCGASTAAVSVTTISLSAGQFASLDATAVFYATNAALLAGQSVTIPPGQSSSAQFYYRTSTAGVSSELIMATATIPSAGVASASRLVSVLSAGAAFSGVSVDTGVLSGGLTSVTLAVGGSSVAFINFSPPDPGLSWAASISTDPAGTGAAVFQASGLGNPGRTLTWNGMDQTVSPARFVPPGTYHVRLCMNGCVVSDRSLSISVSPSAFLYGTVRSTGACAAVRAYGPGASYGAYAVASSTGYFQIYGLQSGGVYTVEATTAAAWQGQPVTLTVDASGVTASAAGVDIGSIPFPTPALLRAALSLPIPAPRELWGRVTLHNADFSRTVLGTLHYSSGAMNSDNGVQGFGSDASTWTALAAVSDVYAAELDVPGVSLSTRVAGLALAAGTQTDLPLGLDRKANVFGSVILPSTTAFGASVSVQASLAGSSVPAAFAGTAVPAVNATSAPYALYGLSPGTWTLTALSPGFVAVSTTLFISNGAPVGGCDLNLATGGVISGAVTVSGDTSGLGGGGPVFPLFVTAFNPATLAQTSAQVFLATSAVVTAATFTLSGLADGAYLVTSHLDGFNDARQSVLVAGGSGSAVLVLPSNNARVALTVLLPSGPHPAADFKRVALLARGPAPVPIVQQDMTAGATVQFFSSSATWQSPALAPGAYLFDGVFGPTGQWASAAATLSQGTSAALTLDLSGSTTSLRGQLTWAGSVNFSSANYAVSVTSVAGLAAMAQAARYCLMGSSLPVTVSALHMELLPLRPAAGQAAVLSGPLQPAPASGCATVPLPGLGLGPNPTQGYVAAVNPDGSFLFPNVPPGAYLLRNDAELDGNPGDGPELPALAQTVLVSSATAPVSLSLGAGSSLSGRVWLPPSAAASRNLAVALLDAQGTPLRTLTVSALPAAPASYRFDQVADGSYFITVQDLGSPAAYAAAPRAVQVAGLSLGGLDFPLSQTGTIRGGLAIETDRPDGSRGYALVTSVNAGLLPPGLTIEASADPWFTGGFAAAPARLDANNEFMLAGLRPGTYDVRFNAGSGAASAGSVSLISSQLSGVSVAAGQVTEVGTVPLLAAVNLRGQVFDAGTGAGLALVPVSARPSLAQGADPGVLQAVTDSSGVFILSGLDPRVRYYDLTAAPRGLTAPGSVLSPYQSATLPGVDVSSPCSPTLRLSPAPFSVRGRVAAPVGGAPLTLPMCAGGLAVPGAFLQLQRYRDIPVSNPLADAQAQTDLNGNFVIPALSTGTYQLFVSAQGYATLSRIVTILGQNLDVGTLTLAPGATLSGRLRKADGSTPSSDEVSLVAAATPDLTQILFAGLTTDPVTRGVSAYSVSGLQPGLTYRALILDSRGAIQAPAEAQNVRVNSAAESLSLDILYHPAPPQAKTSARRGAGGFQLTFQLSQPLRNRTPSDSDLAALLSTASASGALSQFSLSPDRQWLTAVYTPAPGVAEASFTLQLQGFSSVLDPDSADPVNREFLMASSATLFSGVDGFAQASIANYSGGDLLAGSDAGRLTLPSGALRVDASSSVVVTLQASAEPLSGLGVQSARPGPARNLAALRLPPSAYPLPLLRALAAAPPEVAPLSAFYDITLPPGVNTSLAKPVQLTLAYSTATDPSRLNLYWYNAAANQYILQQDVTGAAPVIDPVNRTFTVNVNHFSTFVLFESGVAMISGSAFSGGDVEVFNFPNPFDLKSKTVTTIHPAANVSVRGTMIRAALPVDASGEAQIHIYDTAGERVRTLDLGNLSGGAYYYQPWDGTNDRGRDVASGLYIGVLKIGKRTQSFKMALIK